MTACVVSCCHATCAVPEAWRELFRGAEESVQSAEGWEPGSLNLAQAFSMRWRTPLVHGDVTRLLIDLEQDGEARWSRFSRSLPEATRVKLAERHEKPFRDTLALRIHDALPRHDTVVHLMIRTVAGSEGRVALETPPGGVRAEGIAAAWRKRLAGQDLDVRHHSNESGPPLAAWLAGRVPAERYAQLRLEVSQSFFLEGRPLKWETLKKLLLESLDATLAESAAADGGD